MAEEENIIAEAGSGLGHKLGPLPVWAWLVIGVVGAAGVYYVVTHRSAGGGQGSPGPVDLGSLLGQGGGSTSPGSTSPSPTTTQLTNAQWLDNAVASVSQALHTDPNQVRLYLEGYLAGTPFATGQYQSVVNQALSLGAPPQGTQLATVNTNPFSSNVTWLDSILQFLPAGTSNSVKNELIAWVNGVSTTLSTDAQTALAAAQDVVGQAPSPISFTTTPTTPTTPKVPQLAETTSQDLVAAYNSIVGTGQDVFTNVWSKVLSGQGLSQSAIQYVEQQSSLNTANVKRPSTTAELQGFVNQYFANGGT